MVAAIATPLVLRTSEDLSDWYTIERAEHDGRMWIESTGPNSAALRYSGRITDADVEGTADEMRAIGSAIEAGESIEFRRCAVGSLPGGAFAFRSPRNSSYGHTATAEEAKALAVQIREMLGDCSQCSGTGHHPAECTTDDLAEDA